MITADYVFQDRYDRIFHSTHFSYSDLLTPLLLIDGDLVCPPEFVHAGDHEGNDAA